MEDPQILQRAFERERKRRQAAEQQLEEKARELYESYRELELAHQSLKENQEQLIHAEKLAAMGTLCAEAAHEINTPLGYIVSNLQTLCGYAETFRELWQETDVVVQKIAGRTDRDCEEADLQLLLALLTKQDLGFLSDDTEPLLAETLEGLENIRTVVQGMTMLAGKRRATGAGAIQR
ncbi:MAG: hypothetical protein AAF529_15050 [Pseudomonadota bacterium]